MIMEIIYIVEMLHALMEWIDLDLENLRKLWNCIYRWVEAWRGSGGWGKEKS